MLAAGAGSSGQSACEVARRCSGWTSVTLQAHVALAGVHFRLPAHDNVGQPRPVDPVAGRQRADAARWRRGTLQQQLRQAETSRRYILFDTWSSKGFGDGAGVCTCCSTCDWSLSCAGALTLQGSRRRGRVGGSSSALSGGSGRRRAICCQPLTCLVSEPGLSPTQSDRWFCLKLQTRGWEQT